MNNAFLNDVLSQPRAMREALSRYGSLSSTLRSVAGLRPSEVLFVGMGSSHFGCVPATVRLNAAGLPARAASASEILYYEPGAIRPGALLVMVSQSGESAEVVDLLRRLAPGRVVVGVTNEPGSTLGRRADFLLPMQVETEVAASTRTYQATLVLADMLASALLGRPADERLPAFGCAYDALEEFLSGHEETRRRIDAFLGVPATIAYIGRGPSFGTAECAALFTREAAKYPATAFESAEFRHGPFEIVDESFRAILFAPSGPTAHLQRSLACDIARHGGRAALVCDGADGADAPDGVLMLRHPAVDEFCAPAVQIAAAQFFANGVALRRGFDPGTFRQSSKVTTIQ